MSYSLGLLSLVASSTSVKPAVTNSVMAVSPILAKPVTTTVSPALVSSPTLVKQITSVAPTKIPAITTTVTSKVSTALPAFFLPELSPSYTPPDASLPQTKTVPGGTIPSRIIQTGPTTSYTPPTTAEPELVDPNDPTPSSDVAVPVDDGGAAQDGGLQKGSNPTEDAAYIACTQGGGNWVASPDVGGVCVHPTLSVSWWSQQSTGTKVAIVGGASVAAIGIGYLIFRKH